MEYVDNSLVDAESFYDHVAGTYRRAVYIDVFVSNERRTLRIVDNCRGMPPDVLSRVVMRVGESKKRGVSLVNGQFGLGMQSFRAACSTLTVTSRAAGDNAYRICVEREQGDGFRGLLTLHQNPSAFKLNLGRIRRTTTADREDRQQQHPRPQGLNLQV